MQNAIISPKVPIIAINSNYIYDSDKGRLLNITTTANNGSLHNIKYIYGPTRNITKIENVNPNSTPLGGVYAYNYTYDDLYRLTSSDGHALSLPYELAMTYSASGNIVKKALTVTKDILGNSQQLTYDNRYSYTQGHQVAEINDYGMHFGDRYFEYDLNGNMIRQDIVNEEAEPTQRTLCWDEENRLAGTSDNNYVTANIYDAGGQRHWKLAGQSNFMWVNGQGLVGFGSFNLRSWYPSELMAVTDQAYTKHYFSEGQRVGSALGNGFGQVSAISILEDPLEPIEGNYESLPLAAESSLRRTFDCLGLDYENYEPMSTEFELIRDLLEQSYDASDVYFYHSDHLGSSSFITDGSGDATQHLQYLPFGEDFIHQQSTSSYYTPFTFSGKERDAETSLSYFGARYYDAGLSIWLSVDPMSDKLPEWSPFNYCFANPVKLKDPDGRFPWVTAIIGGVAGAVSEGVSSYVSNRAQGMSVSQAFRNIDQADVLIATVEGVAIGLGAGPIVAKSVGTFLKSSIDKTVDGGTSSVGGVVGDKKDSKSFGIDLGSNLLGGALEKTGIGKYIGQKLSKNKFFSNLISASGDGAATGSIEGAFKNYETAKGTAGVVSGNSTDINPDGSIKPGAIVQATRELPTVVIE